MPNKDVNITPSVDNKLQELGYKVADWSSARKDFPSEIITVLSRASKQQNGKPGYPDRIYCNQSEQLLILVEEKPTMKEHDLIEVSKGAVSGIKWYLSCFLNKNLNNNVRNFFNTWKILGIAVSGNLQKEYQYKFNCFILNPQDEKIISLPQITNFVKEEQFLSIFNTFNEEKAITAVSNSSKKINNLLRSIDSQKRPVLLSALMICLHKNKSNKNDFPQHYKTFDSTTLADNILITALKVLKSENLPSEKLDVLRNELAYLQTDQTLRNNDILKQILIELETNVIPLFNNGFSTNSNYDIIGRFYEEFLKYAGVSNVKKGIVLTPRHITTLFTKLVDIKENDKILDLCCGTGAFLIAGMNTIINRIQKSDIQDKQTAINKVKENQLLGFEINPTMYICAMSNMLFRGDGKSSIHNYDSIKDKRAQEELNKFKATIGFINPPYSGKESKEDPTPKEITFLTKLLDNCSRYAVIIAPLSTYFKEENVRENILKKHTLRTVINMPKDLFQPNASTHTAVAVFETNRAFDYTNDEVVFYDLRKDGFELAKNKGRTDIYNKWNNIEKNMLADIKGIGRQPDGITFVKTKIKPKDEWTIYAHSKTDYSNLCEQDFINSIGEYIIFKLKRDIGIFDKDKTEFEMLEILKEYLHTNNSQVIKINKNKFKEFKITSLFNVHGSKTTPKLELEEYGAGEYPYITTQATNNGVAGFYDFWTENKNVLTIDSAVIGFCSYQEKEFSASDHVEILEPLQNTILNKYTAMFLKTVISCSKYKYDYGRKFNQNRIRETVLLLPAKQNTDKTYEPDWQYMENYIKSLPYADLI